MFMPNNNKYRTSCMLNALLVRSVCLFIMATNGYCFAQNCPPNIDFENGNFNNWTCYTGNVSAAGGVNAINLVSNTGPVAGRHTLIAAGSGGADFFGGFSTNSPNGSGYAVKLGNTTGGGQAEGISYEFTIPPTQNTYSLTYHYAVVFQDPRHEVYQQPRLEIEAKNMTDNEVIYCSSFTFYPNGSLLPGFFVSPIRQDTTDVWCKDWTAVSINLNGKAGKTIRLFFKTSDCTFNRHFGYAYIDVDSECSSEFLGATYCRGDTVVDVTGPYGYQNYKWFNSNFSQVLGTTQTITLAPPPPPGTGLAVEVVPFNGYGCPDTFYAVLADTLRLIPNAGGDILSCNQEMVPIGSTPKPGVVYQWTPATGLSNPNIANPRAGPAVTTTYVLNIRSRGGGCTGIDSVVVEASISDTTLTLLGKNAFCITSADSAVLTVPPTARIQWYRNGNQIPGATLPRYRATQTGTYYAAVQNEKGCSAETRKIDIDIDVPVTPIRYPMKNAVENIPMPLQARNIGVSAQWSPAVFLNNPIIANPVFNGTEAQDYLVTITSRGGCITVDSQYVKVFKEINIYVPSAFTPNKDGLNDFLLPVPTGIVEFRYFRVFNRWGQLLYTYNSESPGWDGTFNGVEQPMQTVVWMAEGVSVTGQVVRKRGTTVLIR